MDINNKNKTRTVLSFDYAMKKLLRQKSNFGILEGFLSELLGRDIRIKSMLESESNQDNFDDKQTRVDILAEDDKGELMIVEVQYQFEIDYILRILYGVSRNIVDYINRSEPYQNIKKVYSISILYFDEFHNDDEYIYHGKTEFTGMRTGKILPLTEKQKKLFDAETAGDLHPEYYLLDVTNFNNVARDTLDQWIYYLKNSEIKDDFNAKGMKEVRKHLAYEKLSPEEKRKYDKALDIKRGWISAIDTAKEEGIDIGREEGRLEGREEGRLEERKLLIHNLSRKGFSAEQIVEITNLAKETIENILQNQN